jgi:hypothetical protein
MAGHGMRSGLEIGVMLPRRRGRLAWSPWGIRELASFPTGVEVFYRREPFTLSFSVLSRPIHYHLSCIP